MIRLVLPIPTSTNKLFKNVRGRGRVKTKEYESWIEEAGWKLITQRQKPIRGPVEIEYLVGDDTGADLSNLIKATEDLLVRHRLIEDDKREIVRKFSMEFMPGTEGIRVTVRPVVERLPITAAG